MTTICGHQVLRMPALTRDKGDSWQWRTSGSVRLFW